MIRTRLATPPSGDPFAEASPHPPSPFEIYFPGIYDALEKRLEPGDVLALMVSSKHLSVATSILVSPKALEAARDAYRTTVMVRRLARSIRETPTDANLIRLNTVMACKAVTARIQDHAGAPPKARARACAELAGAVVRALSFADAPAPTQRAFTRARFSILYAVFDETARRVQSCAPGTASTLFLVHYLPKIASPALLRHTLDRYRANEDEHWAEVGALDLKNEQFQAFLERRRLRCSELPPAPEALAEYLLTIEIRNPFMGKTWLTAYLEQEVLRATA